MVTAKSTNIAFYWLIEASCCRYTVSQNMPRFIFLLKGDADSESGKIPPKEVFEQMHAYNASLMASGAMLGGEGLTETAKGARVAFPKIASSTDGTEPENKIEVTPGPFPAEGINRVVCGYWLIKAKDLDHAIELAKKAPLQEGEVEIRRIHEFEDLEQMPEQAKKEEAEWREQLEKEA